MIADANLTLSDLVEEHSGPDHPITLSYEPCQKIYDELYALYQKEIIRLDVEVQDRINTSTLSVFIPFVIRMLSRISNVILDTELLDDSIFITVAQESGVRIAYLEFYYDTILESDRFVSILGFGSFHEQREIKCMYQESLMLLLHMTLMYLRDCKMIPVEEK